MYSPLLRSETDLGLVSIIIPAYNAELWIKRSIESALQQSYRNIEVIVVENGSTDKTKEIIESIKDARLHLLHSEKGVSNARNKGLENANGVYVTFLDADDWLEQDAIEKLLRIADSDADIISARYYGDKPFESYKVKKYTKGTGEYIHKCLYTPTKRGNSTGNLYRTSFILQNRIKFNPELSHAEDSVFFISLLLQEPVIIDCEEPIYHVYINPESATRKDCGNKALEFRKSIKIIYELLKGKGQDVENSGYIFSLNQLLVLLVHNVTFSFFAAIKEIIEMSHIDVFKEAIEKSDIRHVSALPRLLFFALKKHLYLLVYLAVQVRASGNRKKQML